MDSPLVRCSGCEREWHSATMAEGLRDVGSCPRCKSPLVFADGAGDASAHRKLVYDGEAAPHLVLGVPRR